MNIKSQGHLLTLVQGHSDSTLYNIFFLETARPIEAKFHVEPPWDDGTKDCSNGLGHMTNMAAMPIYSKTLTKNLLWNQKADDLESWYAASGTRVLPSLFKWWSWDDLDLFHGKVKLELYVVVDVKLGRCSQLNVYMKLMSTKGQGHSLTYVRISQIQYF